MIKSAPRPSPLSRPGVREFLDGLAVLIARRILAGKTVEHAEYAAKAEGERGEPKKC